LVITRAKVCDPAPNAKLKTDPLKGVAPLGEAIRVAVDDHLIQKQEVIGREERSPTR